MPLDNIKFLFNKTPIVLLLRIIVVLAVSDSTLKIVVSHLLLK